MKMKERTLPNILVTGTPGVGKTSLCQALIASLKEDEDDGTGTAMSRSDNRGDADGGDRERKMSRMKYIPLNDIVTKEGCHDSWDSERECWVVDDDKVFNFSQSFFSLLLLILVRTFVFHQPSLSAVD